MTDSPAPGFVSILWDEAVGPIVVQVDDEDFELPVPDADTVAALDLSDDPEDVLEYLGAPEEMFDALEDLPFSHTTAAAQRALQQYGLWIPPTKGWRWLSRELERYGPGIEGDLSARQINLYDFVRDSVGWPWTKLERLLEWFPTGGPYRTMVLLDQKLADEMADEQENDDRPRDNRPPAYGWTPQIEVLTQMADTLDMIHHGVWATSPKHKMSRKPPKARRRPRIARESVANRRLLRDHDDIATMLLGSRYQRKGW